VLYQTRQKPSRLIREMGRKKRSQEDFREGATFTSEIHYPNLVKVMANLFARVRTTFARFHISK
jgi:hypothetical protein